MKAILVGLGSAGFHWYKRLKERGLLGAVVERDPAMKSKMEGDPYPFYLTLQEALKREQADFVVNVTSPFAHTSINHAAFDYKLPVLSEKPISFDYLESVEVVRRAVRENIPFMIAENYRTWPYIRKIKRLLDAGAIGGVSSLDVRFFRYHHVARHYTVSLLDDIGVHHFDLIRYLSGAEGRAVFASLYRPVGGWEEAGAVLGAHAFIELNHGIKASYSASIAAKGSQTPWSGNWRIQGTEGAIELTDQIVYLTCGGERTRIDDFSDVNACDCLDEFLQSLREGRPAETSGEEYLKTQALVHSARQSHLSRRTVPAELPDVRGS
ncbi:Gfo/Idh/MocA family protein [Cohnella zeiphila]|uniref:Gfo/Idh/MocA family oxidoreductase n=1 Tax=Cohnella zeiphila TaxID=2761120 RepID=A0A7X0VTJ9_9BACL|nr:Gfo/Idh/MocA family oxidoreductase [Cohnella zeiphila]MBB6729445.1 Gfo/Idh/MocA family oxidoreductase [Cohnella zeiphila]